MRLSHGDQAAEVDVRGGRVVTYAKAGVPVLTPLDLPTAAYPHALLAPWPNRVADGAWTWEGQRLQLPVNDPAGATSLHGLVHDEPFSTLASGPSSVRLAHDLAPSPGYPFSLRIEATYALDATGLTCSLSATNAGDRPAPVALGVHPYLDTRGPVDEVRVTVPGARTLTTDEQWQEVARPEVEDTRLDLRRRRKVADAVIDATWADLAAADGRVTCELELPGGDVVTVWGGTSCRYVVVYTADTLPESFRRRTIAIEPCTAPANALRSGTDLDVLSPGESLSLEWGLSPRW